MHDDASNRSGDLSWLDVRGPWRVGVHDVAYREGKKSAVALTLERERLRDLSFVAGLAGLRGLTVDGHVRDDHAAFAMPELELLALRTRSQNDVDLGRLPQLRSLTLAYRPGLETISDVRSVEDLYVYGFRGQDLEFLGAKPSLEFIRLRCAHQQIRLDGIEQSPQLRELWIQDGRAESLDPLGGLTALTELAIAADFKKIGGIVSLEPLMSHKGLVWLKLSGWERIESLKPIRHLPALRGISVREMEVVDGDLSPLLHLPDGATFLLTNDRPHYSHRLAEIQELRSAR